MHRQVHGVCSAQVVLSSLPKQSPALRVYRFRVEGRTAASANINYPGFRPRDTKGYLPPVRARLMSNPENVH